MKRLKSPISIMSISFISILILFFMSTLTISANEKNENKKQSVLFISSYTESFITVPDQIKGLKEIFDKEGVTLEIEYMDAKRISDKENINMFYQLIEYKNKVLNPYDTIIVGDDAALQFAMDYKEELFKDIPIVFFGINDFERAKKAKQQGDMTGSLEETSLVDNIKLALEFNKDANKVAAIIDGTLTGQGDKKQFEEAMKEFPDLESIIHDISKTTFEEFSHTLSNIKEGTIVLFLSMNEDNTGVYKDLNAQFEFIKNNSNVPVYRASVGGVGQGLIGGKMIDYKEFGKQAALTAISILKGNDVNSIDLIEETPYYYIFDYDLIEKYNIDEDNIPKGAIFVNKDISIFEKYKNTILIISLIIVVLTLIALILMIDNIKRRRLEKELLEKNNELSSTYEELTATYEELMASEEELHSQYDVISAHAKEVDDLNQKYEIAIEATNSAVWEFDIETREVIISNNFENLICRHINSSGNIYEILNEVLEKDYYELVISDIEKFLQGEKDSINISVKTNEEDEKDKKWLLIRGNGIKDFQGNVTKLSGIFLDITNMKTQEEYIKYIATHDYLTDLPNRLSFVEILSKEIEKKKQGTVMLFDIDDFKTINDTMGHIYGDKILKEVAKRLKELIAENVVIARIGGDEFLILLIDIVDKNDIENAIKLIHRTFEKPFFIDGIENKIDFSMGITRFPHDGNNIVRLIMNADTAMYKVKRNGKNSSLFYKEDMKKEIHKKKELKDILTETLANEGFELHYQPQVSCIDDSIVGFEALLRIKDRNISPAEFIPVAEETGLIIPIGRWVAKEAISQLSKWNKKGYTEKTIAINYSTVQLKDEDYIDYLVDLAKENEVLTKFIEIEITEGIMLENNMQTHLFLKTLKQKGFKIALDDFGTGYSSLNYLTYMPVNRIKLDKTINDKFLAMEDISVIKSLISLAHSLKLDIVAEGIEDIKSSNKLRECGCDYMQGYLFSKPITKEQVEEKYIKK